MSEIAGDEIDQNCDLSETCFVDADGDGSRPDATSVIFSIDVRCDGDGEAAAAAPTTDCDDGDADDVEIEEFTIRPPENWQFERRRGLDSGSNQ